ncbi:MAG: hypothetical protein ACRYFS_15855 [Janthinobacterium lividum]
MNPVYTEDEIKTAVDEIKTAVSEGNGTNGQTAVADRTWPVPEFKDNLGNHPLWREFLDALEASRQADIAEANRLADLELLK